MISNLLDKKWWKKGSLAVKILAVTFALLFAIVTVVSSIMIENSDAINDFFGVQTTITEYNTSNSTADTEYFKSSFNSVREAKQNGEKVIEEVMEEGAVLLKNDNKALPLAHDAKISLFSVSSVDPVITGTGSSGTSNNLPSDNYYDANGGVNVVDFKTAFEEVEGANIQVNPALWNWYSTNKSKYLRQKSGDWGAYFSIRDAAWDQIPQDVRINEYGDAAIFVVSRRSGEGNDMGSYYGDDMVKSKWGASYANDMTNGNYLALSPNEISVLQGLKSEKNAGRLSSIIVLINSANPVQCDFADDESLGVDAIMWCGTLGQTGTRGVANLMAGKANPSGRLSDTFWKYHYLNPVNANFGKDMYHANEWSEHVPLTWIDQANINSSDEAMRKNMVNSSRSTVYAEGIYVGYRYTETRYEDSLSGYTEFDYYNAVSYPFGYGLSYTKFDYSNFTMERTQQKGSMEDSYYTFTVKVTNTGSVAGKEVVQIYLQKPYTDYDRLHQIEKASVELVAYDKTKLLEPGESQTLTLTVNERELACYDAKGQGTYILERGNYYFTVAKDAHDAVNNIVVSKNTNIYETQAQGNTGSGNSMLVASYNHKDNNFEIYSTSTKAMDNKIKNSVTKITNQFTEADILYYDGATEDFEYVTRLDWEGTVKLGFDEKGNALNTQVKVTVTEEMYQDRKAAMADPVAMGGSYPKFGVNNDPESPGHLNLIDLRAYDDGDNDVTNDVPIPYNDPLWDTLLDQLTWEELTALLSSGWRLTGGIQSIAKPKTIDFNGSVGFVRRYSSDDKKGLAYQNNDPDKNEMICFYPCNGVCASTFNKQLMEKYGEQWGEDSLWSGCSGLYGMGVNMHRSPYGGRNFEYYSEDPYLTGTIASNTAKGCSSKGLYCYLKHCVLNEQESYRIGGYCWLTEQTMREYYLKAFQIPIEDGTANCVMTAEPALGVKWSGQQGFVKTVLRDEFGMTGIAVSDYTRDIDGNYLQATLAGSDIPDGTINNLFDGISSTDGYGDLAMAMRESAHRILYTVVHSNAMNGFSSDTRVYVITPEWITALKAVKTTVLVVFAVSAALFVVTLALEMVGSISKRKKVAVSEQRDDVSEN